MDLFIVMIKTNDFIRKSTIFCSALALIGGSLALDATTAHAQGSTPALVITHAPLPDSLKAKIYNTPREVREITAKEISGDAYRNLSGTMVGQEIASLQNNLVTLQGRIESLASGLTNLQQNGERLSAQYYANIATINTQLQSGTTPGNPRLVRKLTEAQSDLQALNENVSQLNNLAVEISETASQTSYMLDSTRSAYALSGAVEEDHVKLAELEDSVNNTMVVIERLLNTVSDSISRTTAYLSTERNNIRTLALAVTNGDLYGRSLSNRPFATSVAYNGGSNNISNDMDAGQQPVQAQPAALPAGGRPLAKIKFDRPDVEYEQAVYIAVNEALERYPNARFDLVAVHPSQGNAAEVAIESTRARRNAERVLRSLTQMGVPAESIDLAYDQSDAARTNEVHLYIK